MATFISNTSDGLAQRVLAFALPATAVMLCSALFLVVDTYFLARLGVDALAGATLVFPLLMVLITVLGGGTGVGISAVVALRIGRAESERAQSVVGSSLALALALSAAFVALYAISGDRLLEGLAASPAVGLAATRFARPLFFGAPVLAFSLTLTNLLRSDKRLGAAVVMLLSGGAINAILNPLLMFGVGPFPRMETAGTGIATVAGFGASSLLGVVMLQRGRALTLRYAALSLSWHDAREILRIALPTLVTYFLGNAILMTLTWLWGGFGPAAVAGFGLVGRLEYVIVLANYGLGGAVLTLGGESLGAGDTNEFHRITKIAAMVSALATGAVAIVLVVRPELWLALFDAEPAVMEMGAAYLRITALSYPFYALALIYNYAYQTLGRAVVPLYWVALRGALISIPGVMLAISSGASIHVASAVVAASFLAYGVAVRTYFVHLLSRMKMSPDGGAVEALS